jgi:hypothetical protein
MVRLCKDLPPRRGPDARGSVASVATTAVRWKGVLFASIRSDGAVSAPDEARDRRVMVNAFRFAI